MIGFYCESIVCMRLLFSKECLIELEVITCLPDTRSSEGSLRTLQNLLSRTHSRVRRVCQSTPTVTCSLRD